MAFIETYTSGTKRPRYRWRIRGDNDEILATGNQGYTDERKLWSDISQIAQAMNASLTGEQPKRTG